MAAAAAVTTTSIPTATATIPTDFAHVISSLHLETHSNVRWAKENDYVGEIQNYINKVYILYITL
jgi:hypothetical protein